MAISTEELVSYIEKCQAVTADALASHFGTSTRTIRIHVSRANEGLDGAAQIELVRGSGYVIEIKDEEGYRRWLHSSTSDYSHVPQTPAGRVRYLLNDLLMRKDWITLEDLSSILFVSRSAISSNLKTVEKVLENYGLKLEKRPHYGLRVTGNEMAKRLCLANIVLGGGILT